MSSEDNTQCCRGTRAGPNSLPWNQTNAVSYALNPFFNPPTYFYYITYPHVRNHNPSHIKLCVYVYVFVAGEHGDRQIVSCVTLSPWNTIISNSKFKFNTSAVAVAWLYCSGAMRELILRSFPGCFRQVAASHSKPL